MRSPSKTAPSPLSAYAHAYADRLGWPVFPLVPRQKTPLTSNGYKNATQDLDQIETWWLSNPDANIGIPTGLAFDVLDIDGKVGFESLTERIGPYRHNGPVALTGKGWHLLFAPTGMGNGANMIPKVDFRGKGGYIVVPPSIHPLGHAYQWDTEHDRGPAISLPAAPDWLIELLERDQNPTRTKVRVPAAEDPSRPYRVLMEIIDQQQLLVTQVPRQRRRRGHRPSILEVCADRGWKVRRSGPQYKISCVLGTHSDSDPSMVLYLDDDTFYCFGCNKRGDSFDLLNDPPTHT